MHAPQYKKDMGIREQVQQRPTEMTKGVEHLSWEERQRAGTVQHGEEKAQGDLLNPHKHLRGGNEGEGARLLSIVLHDFQESLPTSATL